MEIRIHSQALQQMHRHAENDYPHECCGFFYGLEDDARLVHIARIADNATESNRRRRFLIDPKDYQQAEKYAVDHDLELLGVYHSHPDHPAEPSEHDRKVAMPWFSYIIISVEGGEVADTRSWRLNSSRQFEEESVITSQVSIQQTIPNI